MNLISGHAGFYTGGGALGLGFPTCTTSPNCAHSESRTLQFILCIRFSSPKFGVPVLAIAIDY